MNAIYGFVNFDNTSANQLLLNKMADEFGLFPFDSHKQFVQKNIAMGYYGLDITDESQNEMLPYFDEECGLYFVVDAILDNRDELISVLKLDNSQPDGMIILEAFKKWRKDCAKYLLGDFAFAVYEEETQQLFLFRDHIGNHLLYYSRIGHTVFFSTLLNPLVKPFADKEYNEQYLVEFLAIPSVLHEITPGITLYKHVLYVLPGNYMIFTLNRAASNAYWDPRTPNSSSKYNKENYIEEFRKIFDDAVKCRLRTKGKIGILLSGGLDSASVGCVAANLLAEENRPLCSYTSIPIDKDSANKNFISDESFLVQNIVDRYSNIQANFLSCNESSSVNVIDKMLQTAEQPYKYIINSYWLDSIFSKVNDDGCKILLTGTYGNLSISYGDIDSILFDHLLHFRFFLFHSNLSSYCECNYMSRKQFILKFAQKLIKSTFGDYDHKLYNKIINKHHRQKFHFDAKIRKFGITNKPITRFRKSQIAALSPSFLNHLATANTKLSMKNKLLTRDPTSDKRLIEFCFQLPYTLYFDDELGADRGLIRSAMKGTVPDIILKNVLMRGVQGADWVERIKDDWEEIINKVENEVVSVNNTISKYIDMEYLQTLIQQNKQIKSSSFNVADANTILLIYLSMRFFGLQ